MINRIALTVLLAAPAFAADVTREVAAGNTTFAFELYARLSATKGNVFFSPSSISTALGMTYAGARAQTAQEMEKTLHFTKDVHAGLSALNQQLVGKQPGYQLSLANRLFVKTGVKLLGPFTTLTKEQYGAPVEQVDFGKEETRLRVNTWVEEQTNQRIKDLIAKGVFTRQTRLALINAIYFKGTWATQFDRKATTTQPFFTGGKELPVPLMFADLPAAARVRYAQLDGVQVLELPYQGGDLTMVLMLPLQRDGLDAFEKSLSGEKFAQLIKALRPSAAELWLPRFKVTERLELSQVLGGLGMPSAFKDGADFSGISGARDLVISAVIHKAFVEVNEEGTEAAAATGAVVGITSVAPPKPKFRADHPFLFAIRHGKSGSVLFLGRMADPQ